MAVLRVDGKFLQDVGSKLRPRLVGRSSEKQELDGRGLLALESQGRGHGCVGSNWPHPAHLGQGGCPHLHTRWANILHQKKELLRTLGGNRRQLIEIHRFFHRKAQEKYFGKE